MPRVSPSRKSAFEILNKVETRKAYSSSLLPVFENKLDPKDAALCHEIVLGVLRKKLFIDRNIEGLVSKPLKKLDLEILNSLRIGLYQLLFLDRIPAHAAINESVNLAIIAKKSSARGFVNAVLRRASREQIDLVYADESEQLSIESSHPVWLIARWKKQFGLDTASRIAHSSNEQSNPTLRFTRRYHQSSEKVKDSVMEVLRSDSDGFGESEQIPGSFTARRFGSETRELAETGFIYFQNPASQLVAASLDIGPGHRFLDLCAAPGGKCTYVAATESNSHLVAGDYHHQRVSLLKENCEKQAAEIDLVRFDAVRSLPFGEGSFDAVLVDAPCSGTGTIRSNPEIRYFLKDSDIGELSSKQLAILRNASELVKPGGILVYSTCSLETEENEKVIEEFCKENGEFQVQTPAVPERYLTPDKFARTFPYEGEFDGFFIAQMHRKA